MFLMTARSRAHCTVELARGLVQVHAGGPEQVHGRRAHLSDEHAGREVVALVEGDGSLPGGLEGELTRGPLARGLLLLAAWLFEVPGEVFDRPGEVQDGLAEQARRGFAVPYQADGGARQHAGVAHGEVQRVRRLGVGCQALEDTAPGWAEAGGLVAGVQSLPETGHPHVDLTC